jgi:hypothetical protein
MIHWSRRKIMSQDGAEAFLQRMFVLISKGRRQFIRRTRNGKDYLQMLAELGLTSIDAAWELVLGLEGVHYTSGPDSDYDAGPNGPLVVWTFKMDVNGILTYIKLKDDTEARGCVCMSFHQDE